MIDIIRIQKDDFWKTTDRQRTHHRKGNHLGRVTRKWQKNCLRNHQYSSQREHKYPTLSLLPTPNRVTSLSPWLRHPPPTKHLWRKRRPPLRRKNLYISQYVVIGIINFHEFLRVNSSWYGRLIVLISIIILTQILLLVISSLSTLKKWKWQYFGLFRKITNFVFLLVVRALSGPFLAVCVSVIYCTNNLYHTNLECYTEEYIIIVSFSCLLALVLVTEILIFGLFYYIKNPLVSSYLA